MANRTHTPRRRAAAPGADRITCFPWDRNRIAQADVERDSFILRQWEAQYQSYLAQSRSTEVAARGVYVKARTALERAG